MPGDIRPLFEIIKTLRQDLPDYLYDFAFPEEGQNKIVLRMKVFASAESGLRLLRVFRNLSKKQVNPVNPVRPKVILKTKLLPKL